MTLDLIDKVVAEGAPLGLACGRLGLSLRTVQRWRTSRVGDDLRCGPRTEPANKLTAEERSQVLAVANAPEFCDLPPSQIVPRLADRGEYIASESTMYRVLKEEQQSRRRGRAQEPQARRRPPERVATRSNQVWSWDITYLKTSIRGVYYYLYMVMDVWSRKIVAAAVHESESQELAAELIDGAARSEGIDLKGVFLHSDNGGPMKGMTMLSKLQTLGMVASFSRPATSNDNPYSEALFRTMKYRPTYPDGSFGSLAEAQAWVEKFVRWYNDEHLHAGITFTSPLDRHDGRDASILDERRSVYAAAKGRHPERWGSRDTRAWKRVQRVHLNPAYETLLKLREDQAA